MHASFRFRYSVAFWTLATLVLAASAAPAQQSNTGPIPPWTVLVERSAKITSPAPGGALHTIPGVPGYAWQHGCGPTAVGMVLGYYDTHGFEDLFEGDAASQTTAVDQGIASSGSETRGSGLQKHYEDYALPDDGGSATVIPDSSETYPAGCHVSDSVADFMKTSWSSEGNFYGWSWSNEIAPSFTSYVHFRNPAYLCETAEYYMGDSLTWDLVKQEIDNSRPMVFLVDSDGDGGTDHFITIVGYSDGPPQQYACLDTWYPYTEVHWYNFAPMQAGTPWGIWGGCSFRMWFSLGLNVANGSVSRVPDLEGYDPGATVTLTANPDPGYQFAGWTGDVPVGQEMTNPLSLVMSANMNLDALFVGDSYTLTYSAGPDATLLGVSPQTVDTGAAGTPVTVVPNEGYTFLHWSDGSTQNPRQDTNVVADINVTAFVVPLSDLPAPGWLGLAALIFACAAVGVRFTRKLRA